MSWWRATLSAGLLVVGLQILTVASAGAARVIALLPRDAHAALVQRSPFGLSLEYPLMEKALGPGPCPSPALVATLRELGSPSLRIGGNSQDLAGPTAAYRYFIPPSFWNTF